jgi:predicted site-specific integrase-resolvase
MAKVNITQAARLAGITRQYLHKKYIKAGLISVEVDHAGNPQIDTSEIIRVFGELHDDSKQVSSRYHTVTGQNDSRNSALQAEIHGLRELLRAKDQHIADLQRSMRLLEDKTQAEASKKRWWWQR